MPDPIPSPIVPDNSATTGEGGSGTPEPKVTPQVKDWYDELPAELQAEGSLKNFKGKPFGEVAKSFVSSQKLVGGSIRPPAKDAKPEEVAKFKEQVYGHLGRPAKVDEYKATINGGKDAVVDTEFVKSVHGWAHKHGVSDTGVQELFDSYVVNASKHVKDDQAEHEKAMGVLETEWGAATPRHLANVKRLVETTGGPEVAKALRASSLANDTNVTRWLAGIAEQLGEDSLVLPESNEQVEEYGKELESIMKGGKNHAYFDKNHVDHDRTVKRVYELNQVLHNRAKTPATANA